MDIKTTWGPPTTAVVITGTGLLNKPITFNGQPVDSAVNTDECLIFLVPSIALGSYDVSVDGQSLATFQVAYPDSSPVVNYFVSGSDNWYNVLGNQFYAGDTTIAIDGVEYLPNVMTPQECAFVYNGTLSTFTLTTPLGSVTYPSQA